MKITSQNELKNLIKTPSIKRLIHKPLTNHVKEAPEITILYGPRQVGKSQEIYHIIQELLKDRPSDIFLYNLDIVPDEFESPDTFISSITAQKSNLKNKTYVFLDEAQRLKNAGLFVKYIYDQKENIKFILTGSASMDIKAKIKEPLTGRKKEFYLSPLTLQEILEFKGIKTGQITSSFPAVEKTIDEYLLFGGYPEVATLNSKTLKRDKIAEIAQTYTLKDISDFFNFESSRTLQIVARFLAENIANLLSKENISKIAGIPKYQTEKALEALEKSFIIKLIPPLAKAPSKELVHRPKVFFQDLGIRNALLNKLDPTLIQADKGQLFENAIATELQSLYGQNSLRFWRTTNQTEVDFVIIKPNNRGDAIETKYQWENKKTLPKNLKSLKKQYPDFIENLKIISKSNYWQLFAA